MPFFERILAAPDGTIWLAPYYPFDEGEAPDWRVLAPDGPEFDSTSELFLFLTPYIVSTDEDADRLRRELEDNATLLEGVVPIDPLLPTVIRAVPPDTMRDIRPDTLRDRR